MNFVDLMNLPCAHGGPAGSARLRVTPEDFVVREWLGFEADGEGDHLLLKVRKRGANTMWVAKQLARIGKIPPRDVGFAGLKDRDAVAGAGVHCAGTLRRFPTGSASRAMASKSSVPSAPVASSSAAR